jgi:cytolysin-activating lysine-acyltransferase
MFELSRPPANEETLGCIVGLMLHSKIHAKWGVGDVGRLILPPIRLRQCLFFRRDEQVQAFLTWGLFSEATATAFRSRTRPLVPEDFASGEHVWFVDFVATQRNVPTIVVQAKDYLRRLYPTRSAAHAIRNYRNGSRREATFFA